MLNSNVTDTTQQIFSFQSALLFAIIITITGVLMNCTGQQVIPVPPTTQVDNVVETIHQMEIVDPYRWLEDQESLATRAWIDTQNQYAHSLIDKLRGREKLEKRLAALIKIDKINMPIERNGRYFFTKRSADQEQSVIYLRQGPDGEDQVLIDPHPLSPDHTTSVGLADISSDGTILAYTVQEGGEDESTIKLFNVDQKIELPDQLPKALYFGVAIKPDNSGFYYSKHTSEGGRICYHKMATDPGNDQKIVPEYPCSWYIKKI